MVGLTIIIIVLIMCVAVVFRDYMEYCNYNKIGMFANPKYDERIKNLEKIVNELKEK